MSLLLPALAALASGGAGDSLALHPADALVYFETPDMPALVAAYDQAPVLRLLGDETLTAALKPILGEDFDPAGSWADLRDTHLAPLASMSLSIAVQGGDIGELVAAFEKQGESQFGLIMLEQAIEAHRAEAGTYPQDLAVLGEDAGAVDAWGASFAYALDEAGGYSLECLGADGAAGGTGIDADFGRAGARDDQRLDSLRLQLVLDFVDADTATSYLDNHTTGGLGSGLGSAATLDGRELIHKTCGESLVTLQHGARVIAFNSSADEAALLARIGGGAPSLAGSPSWARGNGFPTTAEGSAVVLDGFSNLGPGLLQLMDLPELGPVLSLAQGLLGTNVAMLTSGGRWRIALKDGRFVTDGFSPASNAFEVFGQQPLDAACMNWVQPEALVAWGAHFDRDALLAAVPEMFDDGGEGGGEAVLGRLDDTYGFRPDRDLIAPLAPAAMLNLPKLASLISAPDMRLSIGLEDPETFAQGLEDLTKYVDGELGGFMTSKVSTYRKHKIYSFSFVSSGEGMSGLPVDPVAMVKPTVAVLEDRILITLLPTYAKREIRRMTEIAKALEKGEEVTTEHPAFGVEHLPEGAAEVAYADWGQFLAGIYGTARGLAPMLSGLGIELGFDPMTLPEPDVVFRYFEPSLRSKKAVEGGFLHHSESSFGPELLVAAAGAAGYGMGVMSPQSDGGDRLEVVSEPMPVEEVTALDAEAREASTRAALSSVQVALTVYKLEKAAYPAKLTDLLEATESFPNGFLDGGAVPLDGWARALHYAVSQAGYELRSYGPDGIDQKGSGDDVVLP